MTDRTRFSSGLLGQIVEWLQTLRDYVGAGRQRQEPVLDRAALRRFLERRASHVAQTSLYGYLRTRAGQRYPELFEDEVFVVSINIAKWHMWLACVADLAVYAGGLLARRRPEDAKRIAHLMSEVVNDILHDAGVPADAGEEFVAHAERVCARIAHCDWTGVNEGEEAFSESPAALVQWAPIVDELKQLDEEIVMNSVRFRWQEVRRDLRQFLDADAILREAP